MIAIGIADDLALPVLDVRFWASSSLWTIVTMPETSVNKDDGVMARKNEIWFAR
jgi:hypothetical protein